MDVQNAPKMPFPPELLCTAQRYDVFMTKSSGSNAETYSINPTYTLHGPQRILWGLHAQFSIHLTLLYPDLPQQVLSPKYQRQTRLGYPLLDGFYFILRLIVNGTGNYWAFRPRFVHLTVFNPGWIGFSRHILRHCPVRWMRATKGTWWLWIKSTWDLTIKGKTHIWIQYMLFSMVAMIVLSRLWHLMVTLKEVE